MTTIATDGKTMAGDGLIVSNTTIFGRNCQKVTRLSDGRLVGTAGRLHDGPAFREWLVDGGEKPKLADDFEAIVLVPDGTCFTYDENCNAAVEELPTASGSGRQLALAAMHLGLTPEEAVAFASAHDTCTGGTITVLELHPKAKLEAA